MVQRKIKIKRIENAASRQATFFKRRGGLLKKAHDLSVLCDVEIGVIIYSSKGKIFQFSSPSMESVIERYLKTCGDAGNKSSSDNAESDRLSQFIEKLKSLQSNLIGDELERLSLRDLIRLEQQMHGRLGQIHAKKSQLFLEQLEDTKEKVSEARRTRNANIVEQLVDSSLSEETDSGNSGGRGFEHHCARETSQTDLLPGHWVSTSDQTNHMPEGSPVAKRTRITVDLNRSPMYMEK